jgi:BirA family transcriptional regulator, biotin operon repressor / biotin---[acetyl-CoA-carboxylase] ligase
MTAPPADSRPATMSSKPAGTVRAFLGLGSNLGDRAGRLRETVRRLQSSDVEVAAQSPIYETAPWGRTGQPTFLNQVLAVDTPLAPRALLARCRSVENALGRVREGHGRRWGPRAIDVDILLYGNALVREPDLTVPHPELARRAFVLVPLADLAPDLRVPGGATVAELLAALPDRDTVWRWDDADDAALLGHEVRWYDTVPSTNDLARTLAHAGTAEGTVVVAEQQSAGRGRLGRSWASPSGGLWMSVILRPRVGAAQWPLLGLAGCAAAAEAIAETTGLRARVKWPNDVLVDGRKAAGLLLESGAAEAPDSAWVVLGIGVNVNVAPDDLPDRPAYPATSLAAELGRPVNRGRLMRMLLRRLDAAYAEIRGGGAEAALVRWRTLSDTLGRTVRVAVGALGQSRQVEGLAYDVDDAGALLLRTRDGGVRRIIAGEVTGEVAAERST